MQLKLIGAVVLAAFTAFLAQPVYADGVRSEIDAANAQFTAAAAKGDGAGLASLYASDGQVLPAGSEPIKGSQATQKFWQGALDSGIAGVGLTTIDLFGRGPTATEVGQYELRDKAGKIPTMISLDICNPPSRCISLCTTCLSSPKRHRLSVAYLDVNNF